MNPRKTPFRGVSLFDRIFLDVGHNHIGARLGKRRRDSEADAGSGTRDDRGLPEMSFIATLCRSGQGAPARSYGPLLPVARAIQRAALAARVSGADPGRPIRPRPSVRREM